jgi:hypothetical protein
MTERTDRGRQHKSMADRPEANNGAQHKSYHSNDGPNHNSTPLLRARVSIAAMIHTPEYEEGQLAVDIGTCNAAADRLTAGFTPQTGHCVDAIGRVTC